jgi:hypothetical protein
MDMDIVVQIACAEERRARSPVPQVTDDGFEERDL